MSPSDIVGVKWFEKNDKYRAIGRFDGKQTYLGMYELVSEAAAAITKFKNDGIKPSLKPPTSLIKGVFKSGKKWRALANYQGGPSKYMGSYETEEEACAALTKFKNDGITPSGIFKPSSIIKGVIKSGKMWRAKARYEGGPRTPLGEYATEGEAGAAVCKYKQTGIKPAVKRGGITPLAINICPGAKGCQTPCDNKGVSCLWSYHNERDELIGVCCSKLCLDQRYQSPAFLETVSQFRETRNSKWRARRQSYHDMMQKLYEEGDGIDRDVPFTLEEQHSNANLYYSCLIYPLLAGLQHKGISRQCAFGVQFANDYRAKSEGLHLLVRPYVKRNLLRCGVITKAPRIASRPSEAKRKVMVSMVIASCDPGRSLINWESEMQRRCTKDASHGALNGVCLMFELCNHGGGGAAKYADVPGYRAQLVLSLWVPTRWQGMVKGWFAALVAKMEKKRSFPDVLRGQLTPATDDPLGMTLPYAPFEAMLRTKNGAQVRTLLSAFKEIGSKSIKRVDICQRILDERRGRPLIEGVPDAPDVSLNEIL